MRDAIVLALWRCGGVAASVAALVCVALFLGVVLEGLIVVAISLIPAAILLVVRRFCKE